MQTEIRVPLDFKDDEDVFPIKANSRLLECVGSTSNFSPSGVSQIMIPQHHSRYILGGTTYLNFRVNVAANGTFTTASDINQMPFSPALNFTGPTKSAAALIERITITTANGTLLQDIPNYPVWHNFMLLHASKPGYTRGDASIQEGAFSTIAYSTRYNTITGYTDDENPRRQEAVAWQSTNTRFSPARGLITVVASTTAYSALQSSGSIVPGQNFLYFPMAELTLDGKIFDGPSNLSYTGPVGFRNGTTSLDRPHIYFPSPGFYQVNFSCALNDPATYFASIHKNLAIANAPFAVNDPTSTVNVRAEYGTQNSNSAAAVSGMVMISDEKSDYVTIGLYREGATGNSFVAPYRMGLNITKVAELNPSVYPQITTWDIVSTPVDIELPLQTGVLNQEKAFPLWAINGPLIVNITWSSVARSLGLTMMGLTKFMYLGLGNEAYMGSDASAIVLTSSSWVGSNLALRCRCVDVDNEFIKQQKAIVVSGKRLTYYYPRIQNLIAPLKVTQISYNFGVNVSSLLAVFGITVMNKDTTQIAFANGFTRGNSSNVQGSWGFTANGQKNIRVFRDGTQLSTFALCKNGVTNDTFVNLMEAVNTICPRGSSIARRTNSVGVNSLNSENSYVPTYVDNTRATIGNQDGTVKTFSLPLPYVYGTYAGGSTEAPNTWMWGLSARESSYDPFILNKGTACSQIQITVDQCDFISGVYYIFYSSTASVSFDLTGNALVRN